MTFAEWFGSDLTGQTYEGNLRCSSSGVTSLEGCPEVVTGVFDCSINKLKSLEHGPKIVKGPYYCIHNKLTSLNGLCYSHYIVSDFSRKDVQEYLIEHFPEMII